MIVKKKCKRHFRPASFHPNQALRPINLYLEGHWRRAQGSAQMHTLEHTHTHVHWVGAHLQERTRRGKEKSKDSDL